MLIYYDTDTQSANLWGNPLCQATVKWLKTMRIEVRSKITYLFLVELDTVFLLSA